MEPFTIYHIPLTTDHLPFPIYHLPFTIYHIPFAIYHLPFTIYHLPFTIYHLPYTIYHLQFTIYHLSFTIYHLPFIIYHSPFIIYQLAFTFRGGSVETASGWNSTASFTQGGGSQGGDERVLSGSLLNSSTCQLASAPSRRCRRHLRCNPARQERKWWCCSITPCYPPLNLTPGVKSINLIFNWFDTLGDP